ncbi:Uncharacterised protein [uncultured archaeon]|nr:Uncharacterised protein [uncultured archaeon]
MRVFIAMHNVWIAYEVTQHNRTCYFKRIGTGMMNTDGSFNIKLECLPSNGEVHMRRYISREETQQASHEQVSEGEQVKRFNSLWEVLGDCFKGRG